MDSECIQSQRAFSQCDHGQSNNKNGNNRNEAPASQRQQ